MIVAAHQPHYLPWLGYLDKVAEADLFVVMDDLQYEAQNFQNRNRMKLNHGPQWLTVPLERGPQDERILDKRIDNRGIAEGALAAQTWHTLEIHYGSTPYWQLLRAPSCASVYTRPWDRACSSSSCTCCGCTCAGSRSTRRSCAPRRWG